MNKTDSIYKKEQGFILKLDVLRSIVLQPTLALEYAFKNNYSIELGGSYFFTKNRFVFFEENAHFARVSGALSSLGPSKGFETFINLNYLLKSKKRHQWLVGLGALYRYSFFNDASIHYSGDSESTKRNILQTEKATTVGGLIKLSLKLKPKRSKFFYINPYVLVLPCFTIAEAYYDYNYNPGYNEHPVVVDPSTNRIIEKKTVILGEFGVNLCYNFNRKK